MRSAVLPALRRIAGTLRRPRATERWERGHPGERGDQEAQDEQSQPELTASVWQNRAGEFVDTGFLAILARLPSLFGQALRIAWRAGRRDTTIAISLSLVAGVFGTFGLLATRGVLAPLFAGGPTGDRIRAAVPSLVVVGAALAGRALLDAGAGWAQARLEPRVVELVDAQLYGSATQIELAAFDDAGFADDLERASMRGTQSTKLMVTHTTELLSALVGLSGAAVALVVLHPLLLAVLLLATVPRGWAAVRSARIEYVSMFRRIARRRRLGMLGWLMTSRETAAELRAYSMRAFLLGEYGRAARAETAADLVIARQQALTRLAGGALAGIATAGVYVALGLLLAADQIPLAAAGAAVIALQSATPALQRVVFQVNNLYEEGLYFTDYVEFCARAETHTRGGGALPPAAFEEIRLREVSLRYAGADVAAVDGVTLTIRRGEAVALVGENGSGKSSLARLLSGLYRPSGGSLCWDDTPLAGLDGDLLRERVAVLTQDYHHWPFTARQNVRIGRYDRPGGDGPVVEAARGAGAHAMISDLPHGYDTLLDRRFKDGYELSGGQWQRLAGARAFFRDAQLLICDEPSAALDARGERALFERLRADRGRRTIVLITHRLANVRHVDRIYVLADGRLVEQGTHDELMRAGGRYAELFTMQAAGYWHESAGTGTDG